VTTASVNNEVAEQLKLATKSGAIIQDVTKGGPADKAGLRAGGTATADGLAGGGDVIVSVDGKPVKSSDELVAIIAGKRPGEQVEIEYLRGRSGDRKTAKVTLGNRPAKVDTQNQPQLP
jgi:serine protease Do